MCPSPKLFGKIKFCTSITFWSQSFADSVQFSHSVMSSSLRPHGLQHARPPCPSPTPRVHQTHVHCVSDAIQPSHPLSYASPPAFNLSQIRVFSNESVLRIGVSASTSVLPRNIQDWFPLGWNGWISLQSKGLSRVFSNTKSSKASILQCSAFFIAQLSQLYMTTGKTIGLTRRTFVGKGPTILSRLVITFLPRSKRLLISWLQSPSAVILEPRKI